MTSPLPTSDEAKNRVLSITMLRMISLARIVKSDASPIEIDALGKAIHQFVTAVRYATVANIDEVLQKSPPPSILTKEETLAAISLFLNNRAADYLQEIERVDDQLRNLVEEIINQQTENKK